MNTLSRTELKKSFRNIVDIYGLSVNSHIHTEQELISTVAQSLSRYDKIYVIFAYGCFMVTTSRISFSMAHDYIFIGSVSASDWYTPAQLLALREAYICY